MPPLSIVRDCLRHAMQIAVVIVVLHLSCYRIQAAIILTNFICFHMVVDLWTWTVILILDVFIINSQRKTKMTFWFVIFKNNLLSFYFLNSISLLDLNLLFLKTHSFGSSVSGISPYLNSLGDIFFPVHFSVQLSD